MELACSLGLYLMFDVNCCFFLDAVKKTVM